MQNLDLGKGVFVCLCVLKRQDKRYYLISYYSKILWTFLESRGRNFPIKENKYSEQFQFIYSRIHSFNSCLSNTYSALGIAEPSQTWSLTP